MTPPPESADEASMTRFLASSARPAGAGMVSSTITHAWRAMLKIKHVPFQLFDVTVMPIMFTLLFTLMFSGAMASFVEGDYGDYIQYLAPGIMVQTIVFITVYTGVGLNTDIQNGIHDRFRSLPIWQPSPILGALVGDLFRFSVASLVILIVSYFLGFRPEGGPLGVAAAFVLLLVFALSLSWLWIIFGLMVPTPESVMTTSFIFLMPLTFMSDIFVTLDSLPDWLAPIVAGNPVSHLAAASRALMHGTPAGADVVWVLAASAVLTVVFAPVAMWMYHRER